MRLQKLSLRRRLPTLTPRSLRFVLLGIGVVLIAVIVTYVPARYDQSPLRKRPIFTYKQAPSKLPANVQYGVAEAFELERAMLSRYFDTVEKFGLYGPYRALIESEQNQLYMYEDLSKEYKVFLDTSFAPKKIKMPPYASEACENNAEAERQKIAKYRQLIPRVEEYPEVSKIMNFSLVIAERGHLRVLQRCL